MKKGLKIGAMALAVALLAGCEGGEQVHPQQIVSGLDDCKFFEQYIGGRPVYIIRCPNSTTGASTGGKSPTRSSTTDYNY